MSKLLTLLLVIGGMSWLLAAGMGTADAATVGGPDSSCTQAGATSVYTTPAGRYTDQLQCDGAMWRIVSRTSNTGANAGTTKPWPSASTQQGSVPQAVTQQASTQQPDYSNPDGPYANSPDLNSYKPAVHHHKRHHARHHAAQHAAQQKSAPYTATGIVKYAPCAQYGVGATTSNGLTCVNSTKYGTEWETTR